MTYTDLIKKMETKHGDMWKYLQQRETVNQELEFVLWAEEHGKAHDYTYENVEAQIDRVAENMICPANINIGDGATVCLWSDKHAATVIKVTASTVTVQYDTAILDPDFKPEWIPGGFAGHCTNQDEQTYTYERNPKGRVETYRWSNKYGTYGTPDNPRLIKGRHEFYDYNF